MYFKESIPDFVFGFSINIDDKLSSLIFLSNADLPELSNPFTVKTSLLFLSF